MLALNRKERRLQERLARRGMVPARHVAAGAQAETRTERPGIAVCLPFEDTVYGKWVTKALIPMLGDLGARDVVTTVEGSFIDTARRVLVEQSLSSEAEYLFFCDTDNVPPNGLACIERLMAHGKDIIGGWYRVKRAPYHPCVYDYAGYDAARDWHNYKPRETAPSDETAPLCEVSGCNKHHAQHIEKVDGLGFGCMLIHRRVFESISEQWFSTKQGTEDLHFERLAKEHGFETWVDWGVHSAHLGVFAA